MLELVFHAVLEFEGLNEESVYHKSSLITPRTSCEALISGTIGSRRIPVRTNSEHG